MGDGQIDCMTETHFGLPCNTPQGTNFLILSNQCRLLYIVYRATRERLLYSEKSTLFNTHFVDHLTTASSERYSTVRQLSSYLFVERASRIRKNFVRSSAQRKTQDDL